MKVRNHQHSYAFSSSLSSAHTHTYLLDEGVLLGGGRGGATGDGLQAEGEVVLLHQTRSGRHAGRRLGGGEGQGLASRGTVVLCRFGVGGEE
jgi:hypothetical protein